MLGVVFVGELEDGLLDFSGEPDDGLSLEDVVPLAGADGPGRGEAGEVGGGGLVDVELWRRGAAAGSWRRRRRRHRPRRRGG